MKNHMNAKNVLMDISQKKAHFILIPVKNVNQVNIFHMHMANVYHVKQVLIQREV